MHHSTPLAIPRYTPPGAGLVSTLYRVGAMLTLVTLTDRLHIMESTTLAAIAGQVLSAEFIPYTSPVASAPLLAVPNEPLWIGGQHTVEYVMYSSATHSVTVQTSAGEFGSDADDNDQLSRVLSAACKRIESALAALIAV